MRHVVKIRPTAMGTLWDDYNNSTTSPNETSAACSGNLYDDPTSLDLVPKKEKTTVIGRAEGEEDLEL